MQIKSIFFNSMSGAHDHENPKIVHTFSLETKAASEPFKISCHLLKLPDVYSDDAWRIFIEVTVAQHPYDPQQKYNYIGYEAKNPALVPALKFLETLI